jgi:hypothetical protein
LGLGDEGAGPPPAEAPDQPRASEGGNNPAATTLEDLVLGEYDALPDAEREARRVYAATPIALRGRVVTRLGAPLTGAQVTVGKLRVMTDAAGNFEFPELPRVNRLLRIELTGHYEWIEGVVLTRPISVTDVVLGARYLDAKRPNLVRFLFAGDSSFGRRFLDPLEKASRYEMPKDDPDALIRVSDPLPGSRAVIAEMKPVFQSVDYPIVNLESVITKSPSTPHEQKAFVYFTLPESLPALLEMGVRYVSLGNNHVYDYLEAGMADTLRYVSEAGLAHSGAGMNAEQAFEPYRTELGGHPVSFVSASSVSGDQFPIAYYATDTKAGSADLRDDARVRSTIREETSAGRSVIAQLHVGKEYSARPSDFSKARFDFVAAEKPAFIIGHHPHVAQGFGFHSGVLAAHSVGNFVFDQLRLETMTSLAVLVDFAGGPAERALAVPLYVEDAQPRLLAGPAATRMLRRLTEISLPYGAELAFEGTRARVLPSSVRLPVTSRSAAVEVVIPKRGWTILDLRDHSSEEESLTRLELPSAVSGVRVGRDILEGHGDFEDIDADGDILEVSRWDVRPASTFPCLHQARSGLAAVCSVRDSDNADDSVLPLRNRVRVLGDAEHVPNKDVSVLAYVKGENAGQVTLEASFEASVGEVQFGRKTVRVLDPGSYEYSPVAEDLEFPYTPPADAKTYEFDARALRLFVRHAPPRSGNALLALDDIAIINWDFASQERNVKLMAPHGRDFVRVEGKPGSVKLELEFTRQQG